MLRPALLLWALSAAAPALAGYNICPTSKGSYVGGSIVDGNANCPDGSMAMYQSGSPYTVTPSSLDFGSVNVNASSSAQTITITNISNAYLGIPSTPTLSAGFLSGSLTTCTQGGTGSLSPGASCTIKVVFTPTQAGTFSGQASFKTSASATANLVGLSGVGLAPNPATLALSTTSLDFGSLNVGSSSSQQTITLSNSGSGSLSFNGKPSLSGSDAADFSAATNCTQGGVGSLAAGQSCQILVSFTPSAAGARSATVNILSSDAASAHSVTLSGSGLPPTSLAFSPVALNFASTAVGSSSARQTVSVTNRGGTVVNFAGTPSLSGDSADFSGATNCTSAGVGSLPPGASCSIAVTFAPTAAGSRGADGRLGGGDDDLGRVRLFAGTEQGR